MASRRKINTADDNGASFWIFHSILDDWHKEITAQMAPRGTNSREKRRVSQRRRLKFRLLPLGRLNEDESCNEICTHRRNFAAV